VKKKFIFIFNIQKQIEKFILAEKSTTTLINKLVNNWYFNIIPLVKPTENYDVMQDFLKFLLINFASSYLLHQLAYPSQH
jgi:hypothetical protein